MVRTWELASGKRATAFQAHTGGISTLGFVDDARLLTCGDDASCVLWEVATATPLARFSGHGAPVVNAKLSKDRRTLVTGSRDHTARVWKPCPDHASWVAPNPVSAVRFAPRRRVGGGVRRRRDPAVVARRRQAHHDHRPRRGRRCRFSHDGAQLAWGDDGKAAHIRDLATGAERVLDGHTASVWGVAFSPDDKRLATSSMDKTVRVWDLATGQSFALEGHTEIASDVAFSPDGTHLASTGFDNRLRIWDLATRTARVVEVTAALFNVKYAPDGKTIAIVGNDSAVRLVDVASGSIRTLRGHSGIVYATSWSPDGKLLASSGGDGRVFLWDVASGAGEALRGDKSDVEDVAFSSDGRRLVSASMAERTLRLWDLDVPRGSLGLRGWLDLATDATVDASGQLVRAH